MAVLRGMPTIQYSARSTRLSGRMTCPKITCGAYRRRRRFNAIRQVTTTCPPMRAHWRHLANTIQLVCPAAHSSPQPKRQIDRFSCVCTDDSGVSLYFTMPVSYSKLPVPMSASIPHVHWAHPSPEGKWQLNRFRRFCRAH